MSTLPDPRVSVEPIARHGTARLFIGIGKSVYGLIPAHGHTAAWTLIAHTGQRAGARYTCGITEHGHLTCSCPDHQEKAARCKHLGALTAAGLLGHRPASQPAQPTPRPTPQPAPAPAPTPALATTSDPAEIAAAQARTAARRARRVRP